MVSVDQNGELTITVQDQDKDNDKLEFTIISGLNNGVLTDSFTQIDISHAQITDSPDIDFHCDNSFSFQVSDGEFESEPQLITIQVNPLISPIDIFDEPWFWSVIGIGSSATIGLLLYFRRHH